MLIELVFPDKSLSLARLPCPAANASFLYDTSNSEQRRSYFDLRGLRHLSRNGSGDLRRARPEMLLDDKPATAASDTSAFQPSSNITDCVTLDCCYKDETIGETESQALFQFHPFVDAQTSISCSFVMRKDGSETKLNCRQN